LFGAEAPEGVCMGVELDARFGEQQAVSVRDAAPAETVELVRVLPGGSLIDIVGVGKEELATIAQPLQLDVVVLIVQAIHCVRLKVLEHRLRLPLGSARSEPL